MATLRTSAAGGASSGTSNRTVTIVPAVGDLLLVYACVAANTNDTPTCSDDNGSGTYDLVDVANFAISTVNYRMSVFVRTALMVNTTSTVITIATGSNTSGATVALAIQNITQAGIAAIRSKGLQNNTAAATPAPALNQTSLTGNMTIVACGSADTTTTPPASWTEAQDTSQINDSVSLEVATRPSGFAGTTITFGAAASTVFCSHALELDSVLRASSAESINNWADTGTVFSALTQSSSDSLNFWADAKATNLGSGGPTPLTQTASDSLNNWQDQCGGSVEPRWLDSSATDNQSALNPALTQTASDDLNFWSDALLGDVLDRWRDDGVAQVIPKTQFNTRSDSLNFWADAVTTDRQAAGSTPLTKSVSDAMGFLTDGTITNNLDYDIEASDDLNNWNDAVAKTSSGSAITKSVADDLNNWQDSLIGDNLGRWVDSTATDKQAVGATPLTKSVADDLNNWQDSLTRLETSAKSVSDDLNNWSDSTRLGYGLQPTDNLNNWQDTANKFVAGALISLSVSDNLNNWNDAEQLGYGLKVSDNLNNLTDSAIVTRLPVLLTQTAADSLNNWNDAATTSRSAPNLTVTAADSLNFWADAPTIQSSTSAPALWQNIATVSLMAVNLASVSLLTEVPGGSGAIVTEDVDTVSIATSTGTGDILYEDTDSVSIKYEDTETV